MQIDLNVLAMGECLVLLLYSHVVSLSDHAYCWDALTHGVLREALKSLKKMSSHLTFSSPVAPRPSPQHAVIQPGLA